MPSKSETTHPNRLAFPAGMSGPALRALANAGVWSMDDVTRWTEAELSTLHGMGSKGVEILRAALQKSGRDFLIG